MKTVSFSQTQAHILPPETVYLINKSVSSAETKVMLCILLNYYQNGIDAEPMTIDQIADQTELGKTAIYNGLNSAIERGAVRKSGNNGTALYEPQTTFRKCGDMTCHDINHDSTNFPQVRNEKTNDMTCHPSEIAERENVYNALLSYGLAQHVAYNMAFVNPRYSLSQLRTQVEYIQFELDEKMVSLGQKFPGYVVNRIKFNRVAPPGFDAVDEWEGVIVT